MSDFQTFKDQSVEELQTNLREFSKEVYNMKCELRLSRKLEKPHLLKEKKRDIARVLTAIKQKS